MVHKFARMLTTAACLVAVSCSSDPVPPIPAVDSSPAAESEILDGELLNGEWHGSWGGGGDDGVVFQPVVAELRIEGDRVELSGFPDAKDVTGTIRCDTDAKRIEITARGDQTLEYTYDVSGDQLTLIGADGRTISMLKHHDAQVDSTHEGVPEP